MEKPRLILVAAAILADTGSEPGKGIIWARTMARFFRLEILTQPGYARALVEKGLPEGCRVHAVGDTDIPPHPSAILYLRNYGRWCQQVIPFCRELGRAGDIAGVHHVTLGSFRVLPRFDRLDMPYTLGPLGGGECIPWNLLGQMRLPTGEVAREAARLPLNYLFTLEPRLRAVLRGARLTLATTRESADLLGAMGARRTAVVFPDAIEAGTDDEAVLAARGQQMAALRTRVRLVCAGRALWWKGIHLAIDFLAELRQRGIDATLDVFSTGPALEAFRARAAGRGVAEQTTFHGMVTRNDLMRAYDACHLFVNPTMHDSASSALLEAYAKGLPSMTLGLGGAATVTTSSAGLNGRVGRVDDWLAAGAELIRGWMADPARWLEACRAAKARTHDFGLDKHPADRVREHLVPIFSGMAAGRQGAAADRTAAAAK